MGWKDILKAEMESAYKSAEGLIELVDEDRLSWKPSSGSNWMTTAQLLRHISDACGAPCRSFATGDWGLPPGTDLSTLKPEEMLPPAEKLPAVGTVSEARKLLAADRRTALETLDRVSEEELRTKPAPAPWDPTPTVLGHRVLQMVQHLASHKQLLFHYLKLQGKPVNTGHLWGM